MDVASGSGKRIQLPAGGYRVPEVLDESVGLIDEVKNMQDNGITLSYLP